MKKRIMSLCALVTAVVFAFAFKAQPQQAFADRIFVLTAGGDEFEPLDYVEATPTNCPGAGNICGIDLFNSDIYTEAEAIAAGNPALEDHPKVDQSGTQLVNDLTTASGVATPDNQVLNSRTFYKRNTP